MEKRRPPRNSWTRLEAERRLREALERLGRTLADRRRG